MLHGVRFLYIFLVMRIKEMIKIIMKIRNWTNLVENVDISPPFDPFFGGRYLN